MPPSKMYIYPGYFQKKRKKIVNAHNRPRSMRGMNGTAIIVTSVTVSGLPSNFVVAEKQPVHVEILKGFSGVCLSSVAFPPRVYWPDFE